jgi:hypothetical protein
MPVDAPIYKEHFRSDPLQHMERRLRWARAPWVETRPLPIWGGVEDQERLQKVTRQVQSQDRGGVSRKVRKAVHRLLRGNLIRNMEDWATSRLPKARPGNQ